MSTMSTLFFATQHFVIWWWPPTLEKLGSSRESHDGFWASPAYLWSYIYFGCIQRKLRNCFICNIITLVCPAMTFSFSALPWLNILTEETTASFCNIITLVCPAMTFSFSALPWQLLKLFWNILLQYHDVMVWWHKVKWVFNAKPWQNRICSFFTFDHIPSFLMKQALHLIFFSAQKLEGTEKITILACHGNTAGNCSHGTVIGARFSASLHTLYRCTLAASFLLVT